jgi:hypothetical protein
MRSLLARTRRTKQNKGRVKKSKLRRKRNNNLVEIPRIQRIIDSYSHIEKNKLIAMIIEKLLNIDEQILSKTDNGYNKVVIYENLKEILFKYKRKTLSNRKYNEVARPKNIVRHPSILSEISINNIHEFLPAEGMIVPTEHNKNSNNSNGPVYRELSQQSIRDNGLYGQAENMRQVSNHSSHSSHSSQGRTSPVYRELSQQSIRDNGLYGQAENMRQVSNHSSHSSHSSQGRTRFNNNMRQVSNHSSQGRTRFNNQNPNLLGYTTLENALKIKKSHVKSNNNSNPNPIFYSSIMVPTKKKSIKSQTKIKRMPRITEL